MTSRARSRLALKFGAVAAAALMLAGCATDVADPGAEDDVPEDEVETLIVYSARNEDQVQDIVAAFTADTGYAVDVQYVDGIASVQQEAQANAVVADVYWAQEAESLSVLTDLGLTQPLPSEITGQVDPVFSDPNGNWVGLTGRVRTFTYNSELISEDELPDRVADFADPEWEGRIEVPPTNQTFQAFVTALRQVEGEDGAREWLEGLAANLPPGGRPSNNGATLDLIEAGEIEVGLVNHYYLYQRAAAAPGGLDDLATRNKFAEPGDLGSMVNVTGMAALSDHPHAQEFITYMLSVDAQTWFAEQSYEYPLVDGVEAPEGLPPLEDFIETNTLFDLSGFDDIDATVRMLEEVGLI